MSANYIFRFLLISTLFFDLLGEGFILEGISRALNTGELKTREASFAKAPMVRGHSIHNLWLLSELKH